MQRSESINECSAALSAAQGEFKDASKSKEGFGYSYADLADVLEIVRPVISKHGLSLMQFVIDAPPRNVGDADAQGLYVSVETMLSHKSGQWVSSVFTMPVEIKTSKQGKQTLSVAQCIGMTITYARRYAATALLGIAQTDNDASVVDFVTGSELKELKELIAKTNSNTQKICEHCQIDTLDDISHENFVRVRQMLHRKASKPTPAEKKTSDKTAALKEKGRGLSKKMAEDAKASNKG